MMKIILLIVSGLVLISCGNNKSQEESIVVSSEVKKHQNHVAKKVDITDIASIKSQPIELRFAYYTAPNNTIDGKVRWYISATNGSLAGYVFSLGEIEKVNEIEKVSWREVSKTGASVNLVEEKVAVANLLDNPTHRFKDWGLGVDKETKSIQEDIELIRNRTVNVQWWFFQAPNNSWYIINKNNQIYKFGTKNGEYDWQQVDSSTFTMEFYIEGGVKKIRAVPENISPIKPTLTTVPTISSEDTQSVEVNGEVGARVWVNGTSIGTIDSTGKLTINLDTSGADGTKSFSIVLIDGNNNASEALLVNITRISILATINNSLSIYLKKMKFGTEADNLWSSSSSENQTTVETIVHDILNRNYLDAHTKAKTLNGEVVKLIDDNKEYYILHLGLERLANDEYRALGGTYVFYPEGKNSAIQVPHPVFDTNTDSEGIETFLGMQSKYLLISGTHRKSSETDSTCQTSYKESDAAHNDEHNFFNVHKVLSQANSETLFIEFHGFGTSTRETLWSQCDDTNNSLLVNLSEGVSDTGTLDDESFMHLLHNELTSNSSIKSCIYSSSKNTSSSDIYTSSLGGTGNTAGRFTNGTANVCSIQATTSSHRFIHIEQSYELRSAERETMIDALKVAYDNLIKSTIIESYSFDKVTELGAFTLYNVDSSELQEGGLLLEDRVTGDGQINEEDDSGILTTKSYSGDFKVVLKYSNHALLGTGYQALLGLFLANESFTWESEESYPRLTSKIYDTIDYNWFDFGNNGDQNTQVSVTPRKTAGYLRLVRTSGKITASFWHEDNWREIDELSIEYSDSVRIGVRMFANYQDEYSVKLEELTITTDKDADGVYDEVEYLLGTNIFVGDSDSDGVLDSSDLYPLDSNRSDKTRLKTQNNLSVQLFNINQRWSLLVRNNSAIDITPTVTLSGLNTSTLIDVATESRSFLTVEENSFIDEVFLPAFSSRVYQFDMDAYVLPDANASIYPSTLTAWVLTGGQEDPTDVETQAILSNAQSVKNWELTHADMTFGGGFDENNDEMKAVVGYMYNQILGFNPSEREMWLRKRAKENSIDYEDFLLHFSEDTIVDVRDLTHGIYTPLYGVPSITGFTRSETDLGLTFNAYGTFDVGAWDYSGSNGSLYVYLFEPFNQLDINLSSFADNGNLEIEYPSLVNENGVVSQWKSLNVVDGTNNLSQSGRISWSPPSDWVWAATYDTQTKEGRTFGKTLLAEGGAYYVVRIKWTNGSGNIPRLSGLSLKRWLTPTGVDNYYTIPGWDAINDSNANGYVDDDEFATRSNVNASARFRYEARAVPLGSMWSEYSNFCRTNLSHVTLQAYLGEYYRYKWDKVGEAGAYNDDFFRQLAEDSFKVISGGSLAEYKGKVQDETVQNSYREDFKSTLGVIKTTSQSEWISANISAENIFVNQERLQFLSSLDALLREDYLRPSLGLSGYFGLNKTWDNFALAQADKKSVVMAHNRYGRVATLENNEENWAKDSESQLALYYLMNVPNKTYYQAWNSSFQYGSNNTFEALSNYWKAGVPKNYAYQPTAMLSIDIGEPDGTIMEGKEAMKYMVKTKVPLSDYTVIGNTMDTVLRHAEIGINGEVNVEPSHIYYFERSIDNVVIDGPSEMVLARNYTKGLILYRTDFFGSSNEFMQSSSEELVLPSIYRRVNIDGTLSEPITTLVLEGYEGAILLKEDVQD